MPHKENHRIELDALRAVAACYVVLHHLFSNHLRLEHGKLLVFFRFGQEAVIVFFVLSGYVISKSYASNPQISWKEYIIKRVRRIYPIFIIGLILAWFFPAPNYAHRYSSNGQWFLSNIFMLQDMKYKPGVWWLPFRGNAPLWSLSYEWMYYMLFFPLISFMKYNYTQLCVIALTTMAIIIGVVMPNHYSNILSLLPIWWIGVECTMSDETKTRQRARINIFICLLTIYFGVLSFVQYKHEGTANLLMYPYVNFRMYIASIAILLFIKFKKRTNNDAWYRLCRVIAPVAGISYALYVFHYPIIMGFKIFDSPDLVVVDVLLRLFLIVMLSIVCEIYLQKWINKKTDKLCRS